MKRNILVLILLVVTFLVVNFLINTLFSSWHTHWSSSIGGAVALWGIWWLQNRKKPKEES